MESTLIHMCLQTEGAPSLEGTRSATGGSARAGTTSSTARDSPAPVTEPRWWSRPGDPAPRKAAPRPALRSSQGLTPSRPDPARPPGGVLSCPARLGSRPPARRSRGTVRRGQLPIGAPGEADRAAGARRADDLEPGCRTARPSPRARSRHRARPPRAPRSSPGPGSRRRSSSATPASQQPVDQVAEAISRRRRDQLLPARSARRIRERRASRCVGGTATTSRSSCSRCQPWPAGRRELIARSTAPRSRSRLELVGGLLAQQHPHPRGDGVEVAQQLGHERGGHRVEEGQPCHAGLGVELAWRRPRPAGRSGRRRRGPRRPPCGRSA